MAFDPNEARDEHGRWTAGAGGDLPVAPDPRVAEVKGGDVWNKDTAARLENEYAAARPAIDTIANQAPEHEGEVATTVEPSWDTLSTPDQDKASEKYNEQNYSSQYDSEVSNWQESGDAEREAAHALAENEDWKAETLTDYLADRHDNQEPDIPYSADDLAKAITIEAAEDYSGSHHDPDIGFDPAALQNPHDINPDLHNADQLVMPGITPPVEALEEHLTGDMRKDIEAYFIEKFNDKAEKDSSNVDAPDYLSEAANDSLSESWSEMADDEKYEWTKNNTSLADDLEADTVTDTGKLELPQKWDPLNETSGTDYMRTQAMAKYIADTRAVQVMAERGITVKYEPQTFTIYKTDKLAEMIHNQRDDKGNEIGPGLKADMQAELDRREKATPQPVDMGDIHSADNTLWRGWVGSSTNEEGQLLQVAAADELGDRLH